MSSRRLAKFEIIHRPTGQIVGRASTRNSARRVVDRRDNEWGSYAHTIRPVQPQEIRA
jgi:hypothetical protein